MLPDAVVVFRNAMFDITGFADALAVLRNTMFDISEFMGALANITAAGGG